VTGTVKELRAAATGARIAFNDHLVACGICDRPPAIAYLCPVGVRLNDEASMWAGLKLQAEAAQLQRPA
jgi:hypothetical protein